MELKDTIDMMNSSDYKERFKAEYHQLKIRIEKLTVLLKKLDEGTLEFEPNSPTTILITQRSHMEAYRNCLEIRAAAEGIQL